MEETKINKNNLTIGIKFQQPLAFYVVWRGKARQVFAISSYRVTGSKSLPINRLSCIFTEGDNTFLANR